MGFVDKLRKMVNFASKDISDGQYGDAGMFNMAAAERRSYHLTLSVSNLLFDVLTQAPLYVRNIEEDMPLEISELSQRPLARFVDGLDPQDLAMIEVDALITGDGLGHKVFAGRRRSSLQSVSYIPRDKWDIDEMGNYFVDDGQSYSTDRLVSADDIVHLKYGRSQDNLNKGTDTLKSLSRVLFADNAAILMQASRLAGSEAPGLHVQLPANSGGSTQRRKDVLAQYRGSGNGRTYFSSQKEDLSYIEFPTKQLFTWEFQQVFTTRLLAALGVSPIVADDLAGLEQTSYNNLRESLRKFMLLRMSPRFTMFSRQLNRQVLSHFTTDPNLTFDFDLTKVQAFSEDRNASSARMDRAFAKRVVNAGEYRMAIGLPKYGDERDEELYSGPGSGAEPTRTNTSSGDANEESADGS